MFVLCSWTISFIRKHKIYHKIENGNGKGVKETTIDGSSMQREHPAPGDGL